MSPESQPSSLSPAFSPEPNRRAEAFRERFNAVGLLGAAAASAALLTPIPLLVGLAAEAAYLAFVPGSSWYKERVDGRLDAASREKREELKRQILPLLRPVLQARWHKVESARESIVAQGVSDPKFFRPIAQKLDFLLEKWLSFAQRQAQFDTDLEKAARETRARSDDAAPLIQAAYYREAQELREKAARESSDTSRALLESRAQVLERRREWFGRLSKMRGNLEQHLELIEDTFGLVNDQLRARSPEMVLADLEKVIWQTDTTSQLLDEFGTLQDR
jgi:hypothetical protein